LRFRLRLDHLTRGRDQDRRAVPVVAYGGDVAGGVGAERELAHRKTVGLQCPIGVAGEKQQITFPHPEFGSAEHPIRSVAEHAAGLAEHNGASCRGALDDPIYVEVHICVDRTLVTDGCGFNLTDGADDDHVGAAQERGVVHRDERRAPRAVRYAHRQQEENREACGAGAVHGPLVHAPGGALTQG
jgi:hypothetical protein